MSHLQFYRAILSRNFIARQSCSTQLCMSHISTLPHKQSLTKLTGQFLSVQHAAKSRAATLSRDIVTRQNRAIKSQVWHQSRFHPECSSHS